MTGVRSRTATAIAAGVCVLVCGCSSAAGPRPAVSSSAANSVDAVRSYLDAVNALCDALLPKVIAVTHGGSLDVPVQQYLAQLPAHTKLLSDFDRQLALIPVPPQAQDKARAFAAYVRFANQLDAKRLAAAKNGAAAYASEIRAEASVEGDPSITARNAAGFHPSCDAR